MLHAIRYISDDVESIVVSQIVIDRIAFRNGAIVFNGSDVVIWRFTSSE